MSCFIVIEGIDGAGTTTQAARYAEHLRRSGRDVHVTREPSDGAIGTLIRGALGGRVDLATERHAEMMALLFAADRLDHVAREIEPRLGEGAVVISDRYDLSSLAYQTATTRAPDVVAFEAWVRSLNRAARRPDATVVLDVSPDKAEQRRRLRRAAPELYEDAELQRRLAALYADAERLVPGDRILRIPGDGGVDEVAAAVREALAPIVEGAFLGPRA